MKLGENAIIVERECSEVNRPIEEDNLTLIGIIGIKDHMKDGVPEAIADCTRAGIKVIMVTGDNIETAFAIAKNCKIAFKKEQTILGDEFMKRIGGIICENCAEGDKEKVKNLKEGEIFEPSKCTCAKSKDEWILKFKQAERRKYKSENPEEYKNMMKIDKGTRMEFVTIYDKPFTAKQILYGSDDILYPLLIAERQIS